MPSVEGVSGAGGEPGAASASDAGGRASRTKERLWTPTFVIIVVCTLCAFLVGQGANAGTSVYLERTGGTASLAGVGALFFSIAAGIARIVSGPFVDARGRRIVIVCGACVMLCGTVGPLLYNDGIAFIVWRMLQGAGFSAATTAAATAAADVPPASRLGEGISYYGLGQAISMSIGPALAIFLVSADPPESFYFGLTVCAVAVIVLSSFIRYEKNPRMLSETSSYRMRWEEERAQQREAREGSAACDEDEARSKNAASAAPADNRSAIRTAIDSVFEPGALPATMTILFMCATFSFNIYFMGVFGNSLGVGNSGAFYTVSAVVMIIVRLLSGRIMDSGRPIVIMAVAVVAGEVCFALLLACSLSMFGSTTEGVFYAAGLPFGLCMGLAIPVNQTIAVKLSPGNRWGAANALFMLGVDVGNGILSVVWGALIDAVGYSAVLCCVLACLAVALLVAWRVYPKEERR